MQFLNFVNTARRTLKRILNKTLDNTLRVMKAKG